MTTEPTRCPIEQSRELIERRIAAFEAKPACGTATSRIALSIVAVGHIDRIYREGLITELERDAYKKRCAT